MASPFGGGQVSPDRANITLNPPSEDGSGDIDMNGSAHANGSSNGSPRIDTKPEVNGALSSRTPEVRPSASDAGPSRQVSVASLSPERPSPAPSMLDRSFGQSDHASEAYNQPTSSAPSPEKKEGSSSLRPIAPLTDKGKSSSTSKPATPNANGGLNVFLSGKTHRKVSCELCHRRKIKCDQGRPSCGSCTRKGKVCNYYDDNDATPPRPSASTNVSSSRIDTLGALAASAVPSAAPSAAPSIASGSADKSKRSRQRDRIVGGFDSDSEDEKGAEGDLADLVQGDKAKEELKDKDKDKEGEDEIDELDSDSDVGDKRGNDELAGELLELASGPPKKKARPSTVTPTTVAVPVVPYPVQTVIPTPISAPHTAAPSGRSRPPHKNRPVSYMPSHAAMQTHLTPVQALLISLPSPEIQHILFSTFFQDPFLSEGISLLHPQFMEDLKGLSERRLREGDATTLGCAFAFLATALRILPDETSKLLLASVPTIQPRSLSRLLAPNPAPDSTPLDQRYIDLALLSLQLAESESPSVMLVMLKLVLFRYMLIRRDRLVSAGQHLAGAIKIAQALGMGKEWEGIPQGERELRRRVMWSLYIADRQLSFDTAFPYTILDAHQGIHLPSPISETDLYKIPPDAPSLPAQSTEAGPTPSTALFIHTHLARRVTQILDSFATVSPQHTPPELVATFDETLDGFQEALPPYMRMFPYTDTRFDGEHAYLLPHRLRLHHTLLLYRQGVHRAQTARYLRPEAPAGVRESLSTTSLGLLRAQRSLRMLDPKLAPRLFSAQTVFEAAAQLALVLYVEKALTSKLSVEGLTWRGGIAEGIELLDNIVDMEAGYARRAVRVLRDLVAKVDGPRKTLDDLTNGTPAAKKDTGPAKITMWLDSLPPIMPMDHLLRDPMWEGAWEIVLQGM